MKTTMKSKGYSGLWPGLKFAAIAAAAFSATLTSSVAGGKNQNPGVIPHTPGTAKIYSELSVAWRDWILPSERICCTCSLRA